MVENTCCFFGHRTINETEELRSNLNEIIEKLIVDENVDAFLFGRGSRFNDLCLDLVTKIKKYPRIKRIYVRAEYPYIGERYKNYLLEGYEKTRFPKKIFGAGGSIYIERNFEMINNSRFCIVYFDEQNMPERRKSGTGIALDYAGKKGKRIIKLPIL